MNDLLLALLYKFAVWEALIGLNDMEKEGEWQYVDSKSSLLLFNLVLYFHCS